MADTPENNAAAVPGQKQGGQFAIQKVYVKDISFETPHSPEIFADDWAPVVNMNLTSETTLVSEDHADLHEVVLTVTVTVNLGKKTAYLIEVQQAGIFHIKDFPEEVVARMAATICPNILFPFAREVVSDLVTRGGFPQLLLAPVNFEVLYAQQMQQTGVGDFSSEDITKVKH